MKVLLLLVLVAVPAGKKYLPIFVYVILVFLLAELVRKRPDSDCYGQECFHVLSLRFLLKFEKTMQENEIFSSITQTVSLEC